jgi:hypothetical protein
MADDPNEAVRRLEESLGRASAEAQRLIGEAARMAQGAKPPPSGWQSASGAGEGAARTSEVEALVQAIRALRDLLPADVLERLAAAIRELLLALRALIDFYVERLEGRSEQPAEVQDIPIN